MFERIAVTIRNEEVFMVIDGVDYYPMETADAKEILTMNDRRKAHGKTKESYFNTEQHSWYWIYTDGTHHPFPPRANARKMDFLAAR